MVTRALAFLFSFAVSTSCTAESNCTPGSEFEPPLCPLHLPKITKVTILENAAKSPAETDPSVSCASFHLTEAQVRRYFANAKMTTAHDAHYTLDWSPCYASGEIAFSDGRKGQWSIDQFRSGSLAINGAERIVLYCPKCQFKPFLW